MASYHASIFEKTRSVRTRLYLCLPMSSRLWVQATPRTCFNKSMPPEVRSPISLKTLFSMDPKVSLVSSSLGCAKLPQVTTSEMGDLVISRKKFLGSMRAGYCRRNSDFVMTLLRVVELPVSRLLLQRIVEECSPWSFRFFGLEGGRCKTILGSSSSPNNSAMRWRDSGESRNHVSVRCCLSMVGRLFISVLIDFVV
jgi:hypothetical protein